MPSEPAVYNIGDTIKCIYVDHDAWNGREHHPDSCDIGQMFVIDDVTVLVGEGGGECVAMFECYNAETGQILEFVHYEVEYVKAGERGGK